MSIYPVLDKHAGTFTLEISLCDMDDTAVVKVCSKYFIALTVDKSD